MTKMFTDSEWAAYQVEISSAEATLPTPRPTEATAYERVEPQHTGTLAGSAIPPDVARDTVRSVRGGLAFKYWHPDGTHHVVTRWDDPPLDRDGKPIRYQGEKGKRGLQAHPMNGNRLTDLSASLVVTEGTKQTLAAVAALEGTHTAVVGINGIWGWCWNPGKENGHDTPSVPDPGWGYVPLKDRVVYVVPDGDAATSKNVAAGLDALCGFLAGMGADVRRVTVPLVDGNPKTGLDDYLASLPEDGRKTAMRALLTQAEDDTDDLFVTRDELDDLPTAEPLIDGMLNKASVVWVSGKFGTYKTFVALGWACCVATGTPWEGRTVHDPGAVVYVAAEGQRGLSQRLKAWEDGYNGGKRAEKLIATTRGLDPRDAGHMAKLTTMVKKTDARMVVFDTLHRCTPGFEENSNKEAGDVFGALQRLKDETGCTVIVLHHTGHEGTRARGASGMEDDSDDAYVIKLAKDPEDRSVSNTRVLERRKSKEGEAGEKFDLVLKVHGDSAYVETDPFAAVQGSRNVDPVNELVAFLDQAGAPGDLSRDRVRAWVKETGRELPPGVGKTAVIGSAVAIRKSRLSVSSGE